MKIITMLEVAEADLPGVYSWSNAVKACAKLGEGWCLPTKDELNQMYVNLKQQNRGGFGSVWYWSSSQYDTDYAWVQRFSDGSQYAGNKGGDLGVRAVRVVKKESGGMTDQFRLIETALEALAARERGETLAPVRALCEGRIDAAGDDGEGGFAAGIRCMAWQVLDLLDKEADMTMDEIVKVNKECSDAWPEPDCGIGLGPVPKVTAEISLRDAIAIAAMGGWITGPCQGNALDGYDHVTDRGPWVEHTRAVARVAYDYADAMLAERRARGKA